jgi:hypothetical protein
VSEKEVNGPEATRTNRRYEEQNEQFKQALQKIFAQENVTISMIKERLRFHNEPLSGLWHELAFV